MSLSTAQLPLMVDQVKQQLRTRIAAQWRIGQRLPPIAELARQLGTGERNTYSAVRELTREGLLVSRPRLGTFVANRPEPPRANHKRFRIHLPLGPEREGLIHRMARAFTDEMTRLGRDVAIGDILQYTSTSARLDGIQADAFVFINEVWDRIHVPSDQIVSILSTSGVRLPTALSQRYDMVGPDNDQGGKLAGQVARALGLRDPAFVGCRSSGGGYRDLDAARLQGFERGFGQSLPPSRQHFLDSYAGGDGALFALTYSRLPVRPDLVFAACDDLAVGFVIGGRVLDLQPRRDYMLIGFDGQSHARSALWGGITTVAVPCLAMGQCAAQYLDSRLNEPDLPPRSIALGCTVRGGYTTPPPQRPDQPFFNDSHFWPAPPPGQGAHS
jgi:DNA-binding LacI/PurR family transcriptional regulator/DNA-binding transcriptional regulator YhcF (GntR family)